MTARPMPMAEFDACCGQYSFVEAGGEVTVSGGCTNCPLLLGSDHAVANENPQVMRAARAM